VAELISLTDEQRDTLHTMLAEWSLQYSEEPDEFADLRERARARGPLEVTAEKCALVLQSFTPHMLDVWRRGVAFMNSIEEGAKG